MADNNLKSFSDENIINVINRIQSGTVAYNLNDLKAILSEVTSRKLGQEYIDLITGLIKTRLSDDAAGRAPNYRQMTGEPEKAAEEKTPPVVRNKEESAPADDFDELDYEAFPILVFLARIYKTLGWVVFTLSVLAGLIIAVTLFADNILALSGIILAAVITGTLILLWSYAASENIWLKIEIERHLRRLERLK